MRMHFMAATVYFLLGASTTGGLWYQCSPDPEPSNTAKVLHDSLINDPDWVFRQDGREGLTNPRLGITVFIQYEGPCQHYRVYTKEGTNLDFNRRDRRHVFAAYDIAHERARESRVYGIGYTGSEGVTYTNVKVDKITVKK